MASTRQPVLNCALLQPPLLFSPSHGALLKCFRLSILLLMKLICLITFLANCWFKSGRGFVAHRFQSLGIWGQWKGIVNRYGSVAWTSIGSDLPVRCVTTPTSPKPQWLQREDGYPKGTCHLGMERREVTWVQQTFPPMITLCSRCPLPGRQVRSGTVVRHVHGDQSAVAEGGTGGRWGPCHLLGGSPCCQRLADTALPRSHVWVAELLIPLTYEIAHWGVQELLTMRWNYSVGEVYVLLVKNWNQNVGYYFMGEATIFPSPLAIW